MKFKKVAAVLLTVAMTAVMLAGCGKSGGDGSGGGKNSDGIKEYTAFYAVPGNEMNEDNEIQQKIAEITGAKVKETWLTGQTAEEAVGTLIAGGEYPDLIDGSDGTAQLYDAGALIALDDYIEKNENLKNLWSEEEWDKVRQDDGHIYWIPQFGNVYEKDMKPTPEEAFWIQTRVLKWAGYPEIKTLDEYFKLLEDYTKANPAMENGTENVPYTILCDDWRYFCLENPPQFLAGYPNDGSVIVDPDKKEIIDYNTTDEAFAYFEKLNEEFHKGMIDKESFTQTYEEYIAKLASGRVLGMCDQWWQFAYNVNDYLAQQGLGEEGCNYVPLPITIDRGIRNKWHTKDGNLLNTADGLAITTDCDDIEGALQFVNDLLGQEVQTLRYWGIEGVDYEVNPDGTFYRTKEQRERAGDADYQASHLCSYPYFPHYEGLNLDGINAYTPEIQQAEFWDGLPEDVKECMTAYGCSNYVEMIGTNEAPGKWFPMYSYSDQLSPSTESGAVWKRMTKLKQEFLPRVVMAENFENMWAEYMDQYEKCNPEIFLADMQAELERRAAR